MATKPICIGRQIAVEIERLHGEGAPEQVDALLVALWLEGVNRIHFRSHEAIDSCHASGSLHPEGRGERGRGIEQLPELEGSRIGIAGERVAQPTGLSVPEARRACSVVAARGGSLPWRQSNICGRRISGSDDLSGDEPFYAAHYGLAGAVAQGRIERGGASGSILICPAVTIASLGGFGDLALGPTPEARQKKYRRPATHDDSSRPRRLDHGQQPKSPLLTISSSYRRTNASSPMVQGMATSATQVPSSSTSSPP